MTDTAIKPEVEAAIESVLDAADRQDKEAFVALLSTVHGIGPRVAQPAWMLGTS